MRISTPDEKSSGLPCVNRACDGRKLPTRPGDRPWQSFRLWHPIRVQIPGLWKTDLYGANLVTAEHVDSIDYEPYYYLNTNLPPGFDPVAKGWTFSPYCDFPSPPYENASYETPDAACDLADINQMFETGDLVTGVAVAGSTDRLDLVDNDTINAADITEWLSQAATANGHGSPYLRGDTDLDRNVDLADYSALATNFDPSGNGNEILREHGNSDGDNDVDLADYNVLASNFSPAGYGSAAVPEPNSIVLVIAAILAAAGADCWRH